MANLSLLNRNGLLAATRSLRTPSRLDCRPLNQSKEPFLDLAGDLY